MLIQGSLGAGKTSFLIEKYIEFIDKGVKASEILVLCQNSFLKNKFIETIKSKLNKGMGSINAYTFSGIAYRSILNNWPLFEKIIPNSFGESEIAPYMSGVDITSYLVKKNLHRGDFGDYYSSGNLMHQLMRRYTMISHNALERDEILEKSQILNETFAEDAQKVLSGVKQDMLKYRFFDYLKQVDAFSKLYFDGHICDFDNVKYLLVDDFDEFTYQGFRFVEDLSKKVESYITFDKFGGTRRGYLCAYPDGYKELEGELVKLDDKDLELFENFEGAKNTLQNFEVHNSEQNIDMAKNVIEYVEKLLSQKVKLGDIKIVLAQENEIFTNMLKDYFVKNDIAHQFLSGTQRFYDDKIVFCSIVILCLAHPEWGIKINESEIRKLLCDFLRIPFVGCEKVFLHYKKSNQLPIVAEFDGDDALMYNTLMSVMENVKNLKTDLSDELLYIFKNLILPVCDENDSFDFFNKLLASLDDFENLYQKIGSETPYKEWVVQVRSSIVSDNPSGVIEIDDNSIVIATPQKVVDYELRGKHQIWVDGKNNSWLKEDTGTLYNAWVFQYGYENKEYTPELHKKFTLKKAGHLLQKLSLLADKVKVFSCEYNVMGAINQGELLNYILPADNKTKVEFKIIPRDDQAPVLEYSGGQMAVPAVPGAGKTTIMQALIMKLIDDGVAPNEILVLTYTDSAAQNFLNRIKKSCPSLNEYPHISTIHGLARKIISDEDNALRVGVESNFEVCDELQNSLILNKICMDSLPPGEDFADWVKYNKENIKKAKMLQLLPDDISKSLSAKPDGVMLEFLKVYSAHNKALKRGNFLDFDDLLVYAHKLLKEHSDIRMYYQSKFKFIIEDEAQDSSKIQQELIGLIAQKNKNLVRCGDLNQAIYTTFTSADVEGFKQFINNSQKVEMQSSQRCCKQVYELANSLVCWAKDEPDLSDAFYPIEMIPVAGGNPISEDAIHFHSFDYEQEEKEYILEQIHKIRQNDKNSKVAIFIRNNYQAKQWIEFLEQNNIEVLCRADELKDKKVFKLALSLLKFLDNPFDNKLLASLAKEFNYSNIARISTISIDFLSKLKDSLIKNEQLLHDSKELDNDEMLRFWWDVFYWLDRSNKSVESFLYDFGKYYFTSPTDLGNVNLICSTIKRFKNMYLRDNDKEPNLKEIVSYLNNLGKSSKAKYFEEEPDTALPVQILTLHGSKGDEFDAVFVVQCTNKFHNINTENIKLRKEDMLSMKLDSLAGKAKRDEVQVKRDIASESLRLIYVAITRAEKQLYFTKVEGKDGSDVYDLLKKLSGGQE